MGVGVRVLVVEDDDDLRATLVEVLRSEGYQASGAREGGEALKQLDNDQPDLVLLDMTMPGMDGSEFLRARSRRSNSSHTPVILLSGGKRAEKLRAEGVVVECIAKPFNIDDLLLVLRKHTVMR